jgi:hypothetical protein
MPTDDATALDRLVQVWRNLHPRAIDPRLPVPWTADDLARFCNWWLSLDDSLRERALDQLVRAWQHSPIDALSLAQVLAWLGTLYPARALQLLREPGDEHGHEVGGLDGAL